MFILFFNCNNNVHFCFLFSDVLLDINDKNNYEKNIEAILIDGLLFGLSWIGDGATIKPMPLVNMLAMCGKAASVVVLICDFTSHMVDGGKKMQNSSLST